MTTLPRHNRLKLAILVGFGLICVLVVGALLRLTGLSLGTPYQVTVTAHDADNLVEQGRVRIAGVDVGSVRRTEVTPDGAKAVVTLDSEYAPLHEGATVRVGNRSLVEETYLDLRDGPGPEVPSGTTLPAEAVQTSTQVRDVLNSLDQPTREAMGALLRSAGPATADTQQPVGQLLDGLGGLGREGHTAVDAIAAQGEQLRSLTRDTTTVLKALDTGQGQLATMVDNTDRLTDATAAQRSAIEATMRRLPTVLDSAHTATDQLTGLSAALRPIAADLRAAGPPLTGALHELPGVTQDLRGLLPPLDGALDRSPATLSRVPTFGEDMRDHLTPRSRDILQDLNPMLAYLRPYGPEVGGFLANFNSILNYTDDAGTHYFRTFLPVTDAAVSAPAPTGLLSTYNPIPKAGTGPTPGPFVGEFPRVEREPR